MTQQTVIDKAEQIQIRRMRDAERAIVKLLQLKTSRLLEEDQEYASLSEEDARLRHLKHIARLGIAKKRVKVRRLKKELMETEDKLALQIEQDKQVSIRLAELNSSQVLRRDRAEQRVRITLGLPQQLESHP